MTLPSRDEIIEMLTAENERLRRALEIDDAALTLAGVEITNAHTCPFAAGRKMGELLDALGCGGCDNNPRWDEKSPSCWGSLWRAEATKKIAAEADARQKPEAGEGQ